MSGGVAVIRLQAEYWSNGYNYVHLEHSAD